MIPIIAIANRKGGQGKTTVTVNLAVASAIAGYKVLVVDMDSQANATSLLAPVFKAEQGTTAHVLANNLSLQDVICRTPRQNLDVAPASKDLTGAQMAIVAEIGRELILKNELAKLSGYDLVLVDTPPEQNLALVNSLVAASHVIMPFTPDPNGLEGMRTTVEAVNGICSSGLSDVQVLGCVQVAVDNRLSITEESRARVEDRFGSVLFETKIRTNSNFIPCPAWHLDIFAYEAKHSRNKRGSEDFLAFATEVLRRLNVSTPRSAAA